MRHVSKYVKDNNLQLEEDKRHFVPDKKLLKVFNSKTAQKMTFVEINKFISHHLSPIVS